MSTPDADLLPHPDETDGLLAHLASIVSARGQGPLVTGPLLSPEARYFPDAFDATPAAVYTLARRLLDYAGLDELVVEIDEAASADGARSGECVYEGERIPAWFAGLAGGTCHIGVDGERLDDPEIVACALCHAVAHAYRVQHAIAVPAMSEGAYRDRPAPREGAQSLEERLTDVTAVYLGFGVFVVNGAHRQRTSGRQQGYFATWQMQTTRIGTLDPRSAAYLLAVQAAARGLDAAAQKALHGHLETNQAAFFAAASKQLAATPVEDLRSRLGVGDPSTWPAGLPFAPRPRRGAEEGAAAKPIRQRRANEGSPIFRVPLHRGFALGMGLGVLGMVAGAIGSGGDAADTVVVGAAAFGGGYFAGKKRRRDECASCDAILPAEAETCSRCGGRVVGEVRRRQDRLDALEAHEKEQARKPRRKARSAVE